jgi:two-component system chemotaxis sensor kinase CheA
MSSELEALWREFEAETDDNIEALERLLTGRGAWSRDDIGALFRAFHSLKGTFGAMGMPNVEAVAHNAEDLLALVREGRATLDAELATLLLFAVDRLKDMRDAVLSRRADPPPAHELIAALEQHRATLAPRPPSPPAEPETQSDLDGDAEMIGIFSELLLERADAIAGIISEDAAERAQAGQAAAELATGAEVLGFEGLAAQLLALAAAPEDATSRPVLIERLNELRSQVAGSKRSREPRRVRTSLPSHSPTDSAPITSRRSARSPTPLRPSRTRSPPPPRSDGRGRSPTA